MASSPCSRREDATRHRNRKHGGTPCATLWTIWTIWTIWTGRPQGSPLQPLRKHPRGASAPTRVPREESRERRTPIRHEALPTAELVLGAPGGIALRRTHLLPFTFYFLLFTFHFAEGFRGVRAPPRVCLGKHPRGWSAPAPVPLREKIPNP